MLSTSVIADSSTSTVPGLSDNRSEFTIGITTDEEVFPKMTPSNMQGSTPNPRVK